MKVALCVFLAITTSVCFPQKVSLRGGRSWLPGLYTSLHYEQPNNLPVKFTGAVYLLNARPQTLHYTAIGAAITCMYDFAGDEDHGLLHFKAGAGVTGELCSEPWVYRNWPLAQRLNYGVLGEGDVVLALTEAFSVSLFAQQKFMFRKVLGTSDFIAGLGIVYQPGL